MGENVVSRQIRDWLKHNGLFHWRNNTLPVPRIRREKGMPAVFEGFRRSGAKGAPDILGYFPWGQGFAIETKARGNKPTPEQDAFLQGMRECGVLALVAYDLDDVQRVFAVRMQAWRSLVSGMSGGRYRPDVGALRARGLFEVTAVAQEMRLRGYSGASE